jgi:hypothetical protein
MCDLSPRCIKRGRIISSQRLSAPRVVNMVTFLQLITDKSLTPCTILPPSVVKNGNLLMESRIITIYDLRILCRCWQCCRCGPHNDDCRFHGYENNLVTFWVVTLYNLSDRCQISEIYAASVFKVETLRNFANTSEKHRTRFINATLTRSMLLTILH